MTDGREKPWTFVTNHTRVLISIAQNPDIRVRDIAGMAGITERSAQRIVADLEEAGYLSHERIGRRNHYQVRNALPLRHHREREVEVGLLIDLLASGASESKFESSRNGGSSEERGST